MLISTILCTQKCIIKYVSYKFWFDGRCYAIFLADVIAIILWLMVIHWGRCFTCNKYGVQVHLKGGVTIKNILAAPKDQNPMLKNSGVIYKYTCGRVECDEEYIGESSGTFGERFKEHQKAPSPIYDHYNITGHEIGIENFSILGREDQNLMRTIKEVLYIRVNDPSLNRNVGKYHLPHIWDEDLFHTSELKMT